MANANAKVGIAKLSVLDANAIPMLGETRYIIIFK